MPPLSQEEYLRYHMEKNAEMMQRLYEQQEQESQDSQAQTKEEIWRKLEQKRFTQLKHAAINLQSDMMLRQQRCPKCTLIPPC